MFTLTILYLLMFSQPVGYRVILMCLFWGEGQRAVKVGGGVYYLWYSIWFWGQDIIWDIVLSPAPVALFIYFIFFSFCFLYVTYFIFLCTY